MSDFVMVYSMDKYFPSTRSIFISDLLENWEPASEDDNLVFSPSVLMVFVSWICDAFSLLMFTY